METSQTAVPSLEVYGATLLYSLSRNFDYSNTMALYESESKENVRLCNMKLGTKHFASV